MSILTRDLRSATERNSRKLTNTKWGGGVASRLLFLLSERDPVFGMPRGLRSYIDHPLQAISEDGQPLNCRCTFPHPCLDRIRKIWITWSLCFVDLWIPVSPPMVPHSQTRGAANASLNVLVLPTGRYDTRHINADCPGVQIRISSDGCGGQWAAWL